MKTLLIAGGTGYIGGHLERYLTKKGYTVKILTRNAVHENHVGWNPEKNSIDSEKCADVQVLINLCGENLNTKRWTREQQNRLIRSRVETAKKLHEMRSSFPKLEHYISASGISAYGFDDGKTEHSESDSYGNDFLSQLVKKWEEEADLFRDVVPVAKMRIAVVLEWNQGALKKMASPIKMGIGSPLGSGEQQMPWVHISDLVRMFEFVISEKLEGVYNTNAGNSSNAELTKAIAAAVDKKLWMPNVPVFALKLILGKMYEMVVFGAKASNEKIKKAGFVFEKRKIEDIFG